MKYLSNLDLCKNELQNARMHNLATAPANPVSGQIYFNSADNKFYGYNGTGWIDLGQMITSVTISKALGFTPRDVRVGLEANKGTATGSQIVYIAQIVRRYG